MFQTYQDHIEAVRRNASFIPLSDLLLDMLRLGLFITANDVAMYTNHALRQCARSREHSDDSAFAAQAAAASNADFRQEDIGP